MRVHRQNRLHPIHAVLLASTLPLFVGALLSDWAYWTTHEVQWINFAAWLIAGALIFASLALLWAVIDILRADVRKDRLRTLYILLLLATLVVGAVNALVHGKDAWATMPEALILSVLMSILALVSVALGFSSFREGATR